MSAHIHIRINTQTHKRAFLLLWFTGANLKNKIRTTKYI